MVSGFTKEVKRLLQELHGLPPRFRQRLLVQGSKESLGSAQWYPFLPFFGFRV